MFLFDGLGGLTALLVGLAFVLNGCFMLISPKAWLRLPVWLTGSRSFRGTRYGGSGASMQIRILGAVFIAFPVLCLMHSFFR